MAIEPRQTSPLSTHDSAFQSSSARTRTTSCSVTRDRVCIGCAGVRPAAVDTGRTGALPERTRQSGERDTVHTEKPYVADPAALALASSVFPQLPLTMRCREVAQFAVTVGDAWKMKANEYSFDADPSSLAVGGGWGISRDFRPEFLPPKLAIDIDSAAANPWALGVNQPDELKLNIEPFGDVVIIRSAFKAASGVVTGLREADHRLRRGQARRSGGDPRLPRALRRVSASMSTSTCRRATGRRRRS